MDWKQETEKLKFQEGLSWTEIARKLAPEFPGLTETQIREKVRTPFRNRSAKKEIKEVTDDQILSALKIKRTAQQDADILHMPLMAFVRACDRLLADGYNITESNNLIWLNTESVQNFEPNSIEVNWNGNSIVRFAIVGDTHINSKYTQLTYLHNFYQECERQGIKHVYHAGDIDEGEQMRIGHQYECYNQGADDHVEEIVRVYPKIVGIKTHFITGNHDASIAKRCGYNIGPAIASRRADMEYLGQDCAVVHLTPNCTLELRHPWDGAAYALSYKPQKMIDAMAGGEKPNILAIGHFHKMEQLFYRNVHCFQAGTFCAQTPFMRGKGLSAHMGGWILEINVDEKGYIQNIKSQFIPFYYSISDDWKNWR